MDQHPPPPPSYDSLYQSGEVKPSAPPMIGTTTTTVYHQPMQMIMPAPAFSIETNTNNVPSYGTIDGPTATTIIIPSDIIRVNACPSCRIGKNGVNKVSPRVLSLKHNEIFLLQVCWTMITRAVEFCVQFFASQSVLFHVA
jgi:hypothetical protein